MVSTKKLTAAMMIYKNTKAMVRSPNEDTDILDFVAGVFEGDTLNLYTFVFLFCFFVNTK